ncbi:MAG TPA: hypothetical protein VF476_01390 [Chitinophagaceae bacterium]
MKENKNIKNELLAKIEALSLKEQEAILGIVENYVHSKADETEWKQLPGAWRERIEESLRQADKNQFLLHEDAITYLRKKYDPNG